MTNQYETKWTTNLTSNIYKAALQIRHEVFVLEQGVSIEEEIDDLEDQTTHIVIYVDKTAVATARIYDLGHHTMKVQRVAVKKTFRKQGYGAILMKEIEQKVKELGVHKITLGAQNTALTFYKKLGYEIEGAEFLDAGIPHHTMTKMLH